MAEVLELAELAHDDRVAEVHVGGRGVDAHLHAEGDAGLDRLLQLFEQRVPGDLVDHPAHEDLVLFFRTEHAGFRPF